MLPPPPEKLNLNAPQKLFAFQLIFAYQTSIKEILKSTNKIISPL